MSSLLETVQSADPIEILKECDRVTYENSFYEFFKGAWSAFDPAPLIVGPPMEAIAEHLEAVCWGQIRRLIINVPPRMLKSSLSSVAFPAWVWAQRNQSATSGPGVPFLTASYAANLSMRDSVKCRRLIDSDWYQALWGDRYRLTSDQNTKGRFDNDKNGTRLSTSVGSALTGEGGNCFVGGTLVSTPVGPRPIEHLSVGDEVSAFDHLRQKVVKSRIVANQSRLAEVQYEIHTTAGNRFVCTGNHPIYSPGRGYIRVDQLGLGDRVLIEGWAPHNPTSDMRQLRQACRQAAVRGQEGSGPGELGQLLLQGLLFPSSFRQAAKGLHRLWVAQGRTAYKILLRGMQTFVASFAAKDEVLPQMPSGVRGLDEVLLAGLRRRGSLRKNDWIAQFKVQRAWQVLKSICADDGSDPRERRPLLRRLWGAGQTNSSLTGPEEVAVADSSLGREQSQQCPREPDHALHILPHETPCWDVAEISRISIHRGEQVRVYDIQVEEFSNFFAEGVLAHNCIIVDDPNAAQEAFSEATIATTIDWWDTALSTRLNNPNEGAFIIIQQRLAENDLTGHILEQSIGDWTHLMLPMRYEPERSFHTVIGWKDWRTKPGELLWPDRFDNTAVDALERTLGMWSAAGQLQQRPEVKGGGVIQRTWWQVWDKPKLPPMDFIVASLDTAFTTKQENDACAMTVWGVFSGDQVATANSMIDRTGGRMSRVQQRSYNDDKPAQCILMYAWNERLEFHELFKRVIDTCKSCKVDKLLIENKANGISLAQEMRRLLINEEFSIQLIDPKSMDKLARLYSVQHLFSEGMIWAPPTEPDPLRPEVQTRMWADMVISQVAVFPKGKNDDIVDTVSMALRHIRDLGLLTRAPERLAEIEDAKLFRGKDAPPLYPV